MTQVSRNVQSWVLFWINELNLFNPGQNRVRTYASKIFYRGSNKRNYEQIILTKYTHTHIHARMHARTHARTLGVCINFKGFSRNGVTSTSNYRIESYCYYLHVQSTIMALVFNMCHFSEI